MESVERGVDGVFQPLDSGIQITFEAGDARFHGPVQADDKPLQGLEADVHVFLQIADTSFNRHKTSVNRLETDFRAFFQVADASLNRTETSFNRLKTVVNRPEPIFQRIEAGIDDVVLGVDQRTDIER